MPKISSIAHIKCTQVLYRVYFMSVTLKIFSVGLECAWPEIIVFGVNCRVHTLSSTEASWDIGEREDWGEGDIKRMEAGEREKKQELA